MGVRHTSQDSQQTPQHTLLIAGTSAILSAMTAAGVMGWWYIPTQVSALSLYIAFIAYFHLSEFFAVSIVKLNASGQQQAAGKECDGEHSNTKNTKDVLEYEAFLLDNGMEYVWAVTAAAIEFAVEWSLWRHSKGSQLLRLAGILMAVAGQALRTWTILHAGPSFTHLVAERCDRGHRLVTDGPFAKIRHPAYAGFFLWATGLQVLLANPVCLIGYVMVLHDFFGKRIEEEERALLERFGADYVSYRRRTVSGIPMVE